MNGQELKVLREKLGLSQTAFAEKLGISAGAVSKIESGANGLRGSTKKLAEILAIQPVS